jgi:hypothetical protein
MSGTKSRVATEGPEEKYFTSVQGKKTKMWMMGIHEIIRGSLCSPVLLLLIYRPINYSHNSAKHGGCSD